MLPASTLASLLKYFAGAANQQKINSQKTNQLVVEPLHTIYKNLKSYCLVPGAIGLHAVVSSQLDFNRSGGNYNEIENVSISVSVTVNCACVH